MNKSPFKSKLLIVLIALMIAFILSLIIRPYVKGLTISNCGDITSSGYYEMNQTIISDTDCINIYSDNVILNCSWFSIINSGEHSYEGGIGIDGNNNITIQNCILKNFEIYLNNGYGFNLKNILIENSTEGITSVNSNDTEIVNYTGKDIIREAIIFEDSNNLTINDSYFVNVGYEETNNILIVGDAYNIGNYKNILIENTTIFNSSSISIKINNIDNVILENLNLTKNHGGIYLKYINNFSLLNSFFSESENYNVEIDYADNGKIENNNFYNSDWYGLYLYFSNDILIENNNFSNFYIALPNIYSDNNSFKNIEINDSNVCFYVRGSYINTTILNLNCSEYDLYSRSNSELNVYETSLRDKSILRALENSEINLYNVSGSEYFTDNTSQITKFWKLTIVNPINNSLVIKDKNNNVVFNQTINETYLWLKEFESKDNQTSYFSPYSLKAEKLGFFPKTFNIVLNSNKIFNVESLLKIPNVITGNFCYTTKILKQVNGYEKCNETGCFWINETKYVMCPFSCRENMTNLGAVCGEPDFTIYFIAILIIIIIFVFLAKVS